MNAVQSGILLAAVGYTLGTTACSIQPKFQETLLASDGNFLFYNNPVAQIIDANSFAVSYLTSDGKIVLDLWEHNEKIKSYIIHDYKTRALDGSANADDHAAPAVFLDRKKNRILVATAYHGTEMYVYAFSLDRSTVEEISVWPGKYTYPRFFEAERGVLLLARKQSDKGLSGDLVMRDLETEAEEEKVVLQSEDGGVIYAGTPTIYKGNLWVSYSKYSYLEKRLIGLNLIEYDPKLNKIVSSCDLERLVDENYFSNRPTGLKGKGEHLFLATSFFSAPVTYEAAEQSNYKEKESVLVLQGDGSDCQSFKILFRKNNVKMPYYDVDVAFNDSGEFLFFDGDKVVSNGPFQASDCFSHKYMLYPNFIGNDMVFYAVMNHDYSIRRFDNSIYLCSKSL